MEQSQDVLVVVALSAVGFVSTSLDNLLLLIGFFSQAGGERRRAAAGYVVAVAIAVVAAYGLGNVADMAPARYLGYLGIVPIGLGLYYLGRLFLAQAPNSRVSSVRSGSLITVMLVMLANSSDSLAVYAAIVADTADRYEPVILITAVACAIITCGFARLLLSWPNVDAFHRRIGRYLFPLLLIAVGAYLLLNTRTDSYPAATIVKMVAQ